MMEMGQVLGMFVFIAIKKVLGLNQGKILMGKQLKIIVAIQYPYLQMGTQLLQELIKMMETEQMLVMFVFMRILEALGLKQVEIQMGKQLLIRVAIQYPYLQMEILQLLELYIMMEMVVLLVMYVFMRILEALGLRVDKILMGKQLVIIVAIQYPYLQMEVKQLLELG